MGYLITLQSKAFITTELPTHLIEEFKNYLNMWDVYAMEFQNALRFNKFVVSVKYEATGTFITWLYSVTLY